MVLRSIDILTQTPQGLYCPLGDFHIDPVRPVKRALVTHGHSDHARSGHRSVMATRETLLIMGARYGTDFAGSMQEAKLGEAIRIGDVTVRFTPAGHVLGSAQIGIEAGATRIVVSGDYKRAAASPDFLVERAGLTVGLDWTLPFEARWKQSHLVPTADTEER